MVFGAKEERIQVSAELQSAMFKTTDKARNLGVVMVLVQYMAHQP